MNHPRVVASIEARMGASRLPGKVLMDLAGRPALGRMLDRVRACNTIDDIVIATTTEPDDDAIVEWAQQEEVAFYRGSENDVLLRVVEAQRSMDSDIVVELSGDCPLSDPEVIDLGVDTYFANDCDMVTTASKPSFPAGVDVQVFSLKELEEVERSVSDPAVREHVSLYFYEHPERYRLLHLRAPRRWHYPDHRFLLDYPQDLEFLQRVFASLSHEHGTTLGLDRVIDLLHRQPELLTINWKCKDKPIR